MALSDNALVTLTQAKSFLRIDAAASLRVDAEYVGTGDSADKTFSLDHAAVEGSLRLYVNGVLQAEVTHFSISGADITFKAAPPSGHHITASYNYAAPSDTFEDYDDDLLERLIEAATKRAEDYTGRVFVQDQVTESHGGNGSNVLRLYRQPIVSVSSVSYRRIGRSVGDGESVSFSLGYTPKSGSLTVYVNGVLQTVDEDYTLSGQIVTLTSAPDDGAEIIFRFEVSLVLGSNYFERIHMGRLLGSWLSGYEYVVVYITGHGATRAEAQAALPNATMAVLLIIADLYENRGDRVDSVSVSGIGSTSYKLPSRAAELLSPLRTEL